MHDNENLIQDNYLKYKTRFVVRGAYSFRVNREENANWRSKMAIFFMFQLAAMIQIQVVSVCRQLAYLVHV